MNQEHNVNPDHQSIKQVVQEKKQYIYQNDDDDFFYDPLPEDELNGTVKNQGNPVYNYHTNIDGVEEIQEEFNQIKIKNQHIKKQNSQAAPQQKKLIFNFAEEEQKQQSSQSQKSLIKKHERKNISRIDAFEWPLQKDLYKYRHISKPSLKYRRAYMQTMRSHLLLDHPNTRSKFVGYFNRYQTVYVMRCRKQKGGCHRCYWKLVFDYNKQKSQFNLKFYNNMHRHVIFKQDIRRNMKSMARLRMRQMIKDENPLQNKLKQIQNRDYQTKKKFCQEVVESKKQKLPLTQTLDHQILNLRTRHYKVYTAKGEYKKQRQSKQEYTRSEIKSAQLSDEQQVILILHPIMKHLFRNYNRAIFIDKQPFFQNKLGKKYVIIMINGISFKATKVCFGLAIIRSESLKKYEIMFKIFFDYHQTYPNLATIDYTDQTLIQAFKNSVLKQHPKIIFVERGMRSKYIYTVKFTLNVIQAQDILLSKMTDHLKESPSRLWQYNRRFHFNPQNMITMNVKKCYDHYFGPFVGFNLYVVQSPAFVKHNLAAPYNPRCNLHTEKNWNFTNNIIPLKHYLQKIMEEIEDVNKNYFQHVPFKEPMEYYFNHIDNIDKIKCTLSKKPFGFLIRNINAATSYTISVRHQKYFYFVENNHYSFIVSETGKRNPPLRCDCRFYEKSGIPCEHIIKVAQEYQINLINCIDVFWLINFAIVGLDSKPEKPQRPQQISGKRGRPKTSDRISSFGRIQEAIQRKQ